MDLTTKAKILVNYVMPLEIPDENTGEKTVGVSLEYFFFGEKGETFMNCVTSKTDTSGIRRSKAFLRGEGWIDKFVSVPSIYEGDFVMQVDKDGKTKLTLSDLTYLDSFQILLNKDILADDKFDKSDGEPKQDAASDANSKSKSVK